MIELYERTAKRRDALGRNNKGPLGCGEAHNLRSPGVTSIPPGLPYMTEEEDIAWARLIAERISVPTFPVQCDGTRKCTMPGCPDARMSAM
jgi:hypothetical protein